MWSLGKTSPVKGSIPSAKAVRSSFALAISIPCSSLLSSKGFRAALSALWPFSVFRRLPHPRGKALLGAVYCTQYNRNSRIRQELTEKYAAQSSMDIFRTPCQRRRFSIQWKQERHRRGRLLRRLLRDLPGTSENLQGLQAGLPGRLPGPAPTASTRNSVDKSELPPSKALRSFGGGKSYTRRTSSRA